MYFKNLVLVAHQNIISYYDTDKERWIEHLECKFNEEESNGPDHQISEVEKRMRHIVLNVFSHETEKDGVYKVGVLFQSGLIKSY